MDKKEVTRPKNWFESLNYAIEGVIYAFKTQRHIRYHYLIAAAALFISLFLELPMTEFVLFTMAVLFLLFAEMVNTALEEIVNLVEEKHHMTAKNAKDVAAGAVLIASVGVAVMVYTIFSKYLHEPIGVAIREARAFSVHIAVISLLLVLISVVCLKALTRRGRPLHGGMPSGHAAVAFSIFTSITVLTLDPTVAILAFALALMVSHSRLLGGIHSKLEIFLGGLLGFGLTLLVFRIFFMTLQ
ncbi:MAG: diacylglycerol kinase [Deltaproteobacteria bacterium]|nr:diacylglycerol kinase [Deltaproteobacteria bacterium]MBZ0219324.1 diacylglycerol kinase [Deltaproteobacteria bacterium]